MSVTDEELTAFADGELPEADAARVSAAIAAEPALAARLEAERHLRTLLRGQFAPVAEEAVPDSLTQLIAAAAAQEAASGTANERAEAAVVDISAARKARENRPASARRWGIGFAIAASLLLGLMTGMQFGQGDVIERNGALLASGKLERGLNTALAAAPGGDIRILASFRRDGGDYCRVYAAASSSGIACKDKERWVLQRLVGTSAASDAQYRQAGSADGELMAAAQNMAVGDPFDAAQERAAADRGWRN